MSSIHLVHKPGQTMLVNRRFVEEFPRVAALFSAVAIVGAAIANKQRSYGLMGALAKARAR